MKGVVEIYGTTETGKRDLLYQGENTTTVGFSENIVDMLTTPSSIASIVPTHASGYLISKNYIVNAFSMSKAKDQFTTNQHAYSTNNFLINSEVGEPPKWFTGEFYSDVAAALYSTRVAVGITTDGSVVPWGVNDHNLLSDAPSGTGFIDIDVGTFFAVAIDSDGSLSAWGSPVLALVYNTPTGTGFTKVAVGHNHALALASDGSISVWGLDTYGEVYDTPTGTGFTDIAVSRFSSFAIDSAGSCVHWGNPYTDIKNVPVGTGFTKIAAGNNHALALDSAGSVSSWGAEWCATYTGASCLIASGPQTTGYTDIAGGADWSVAIGSTGALVSWGNLVYIGDPVSGTGFTKVAAGFRSGIAVNSAGTLDAWGSDSDIIDETPAKSGVRQHPAWNFSSVVLSSNYIQGSEFGTSGHALSAQASSSYLGQEISYEGGAASAFDAPYFSATDFIFSTDVKFNIDNPLVQVSSTSAGQYLSYSQLAVSCNGDINRLFLQWDNSGLPSVYDEGVGASSLGGIKSLGGGWYRAFVYGKYLSGVGSIDSTRVYIYPFVGQNGDSLVDAAYDLSILTTSSYGSIFINRPQLELGTHPTNYVEVPCSPDGSCGLSNERDNLLRFSRLNATPPYGQDPDDPLKVAINYYVVSGTGGSTLSGYYDGTLSAGVSAYIPHKNELIPVANPEDRELTPGAITPVEEAFGVNITKGQNSACQSLWDTLYVSSYDDSWTYTSGYSPVFGRHLTYTGTYISQGGMVPSGVNSTDIQREDDEPIYVTNWAHYVSAYTEEGMSNPVSSTAIGLRGLLSNYGYNQCSPDRDGFIPIVNKATPAGAGDSTDTSDNWPTSQTGWVRPALFSELLPNFSSTGEITYHMRLLNMTGTAGFDFTHASGMGSDSILLNLFGGVDVIGLWGYDLKEIRKAALQTNRPTYITNYPPLNMTYEGARVSDYTGTTSDHPGYPFARYKLYSKKVLTDSIVKNEGLGTSAGVFGTYLNLDMYWTVKFL